MSHLTPSRKMVASCLVVVLFGWIACSASASASASASPAGGKSSQQLYEENNAARFRQQQAAGIYEDRIRPPLRSHHHHHHQQQQQPRYADDMAASASSVQPRFSHQGPSSSTEDVGGGGGGGGWYGGVPAVYGNGSDDGGAARPTRKKQYLHIAAVTSGAEKQRLQQQQQDQAAAAAARSAEADGGVGPEYSLADLGGGGGGVDDGGQLGHQLVQQAFRDHGDDLLFSSEGDGVLGVGSGGNLGKQIDPVLASYYETGVRRPPNTAGNNQPAAAGAASGSQEQTNVVADKNTRNNAAGYLPQLAAANKKKTENADGSRNANKNSDSREDSLDDYEIEAFAFEPSSSGSSYGNDLGVGVGANPGLFLPVQAHGGPTYQRRPPQPDYVHKFKFYPAVGYHKNAKIIYLDDHDYYHPYYTPGGFETLKTVKKSVSKIQKELKKATKFQPHYDHLYGKGRVKHYLVSKPPPKYGPAAGYGYGHGGGGYGYGAGKKAFHTPHPVTVFPGLGNLDDYLNYGDNVEFDREGKDDD